MKTYHFSATFDGCDIAHHGEFETAFVNSEDIKEKAKTVMRKRLIDWGFAPDDLICFEVYNDERNIIFEWKKQ